MTSSAEQMRAWTGPALLSYGFRPMFLGAALWAAIAMALWIGVLTGRIGIPSAFDPLAFHVHELLWGFGAAVIAGFLLTAVPNWTGRLPIVGWPLGGLFALWVAGRIAVVFSAGLPPLPVAIVDLSFLSVLAFALGREIVAGGNTKNLPVLGLVSVFVVANGIFHLEAASGAAASSGVGMRLGLAVVIVLIVLIGGRIVPSLTRNWLARRPPGAMPVPFGRFDKLAVGAAVLALASFVAAPVALATGILAGLTGVLQLARLLRWAGWRTGREALVAILHVGYAFVPLGFLLLAGAILVPAEVPRVAALHAFLAGAMAVMTLAVMTRASLGHTGRDLHAGAGTVAIYALAITGALARLAAAFLPGMVGLLHVSAAGWIGAFALFALLYGPLLATPRR